MAGLGAEGRVDVDTATLLLRGKAREGGDDDSTQEDHAFYPEVRNRHEPNGVARRRRDQTLSIDTYTFEN